MNKENSEKTGFEIKTGKYNLRFNEDKSQVYLIVFNTGRLITYDETVDFLKSKGILEFDKERLKDYYSANKFNEEILLAEGQAVIHGLNSRLHALVDLEPKILPEINDDGTVNFKNIQSFPMVEKGDVVAEILPPTKGKDGIDVFGNIITAENGEFIDPPLGNNLANDPTNSNLIVALRSGHILINSDGLLEIRDVLVVNGDLDYSVGNIDFKGTVIIKGDIKTGFSIKAEENIQIEGTVEDAKIYSNKSVFIKGGFIGKGKGLVQADEDVTVHHVENQNIKSKRNIIIGEECINSQLYAENDIKILGKKGTILGGKVYARNRINIKNAGNEHGIPTILSAGITKEILEKIRKLEETIDKNEENLKKIKQNSYDLYRLKLDNKLPAEKEKLLNFLRKAQSALPKQIEQDKKTLTELKKMKEKYKYSHIEIVDMCYSKVKILMGEDCLEVRDSYRNALFRMEKGMVSLFIKGKRIKLY